MDASIQVKWTNELRTQTRRLKRDTYHSLLYVSVEVDTGDNAEPAAGFVAEAVDKAAASLCAGPLTVERTAFTRMRRWSEELRRHTLAASFTVQLTAKRAANVVTDRDAFLAAVGAANIEAALVAAVQAGLAAWRKRAAAESAANVACQLADHWAKQARERADKACCYAQRLAALKAEFDAECAVQAEAVAAEAQSDPTKVPTMHDGSAIEAVAVAASLKVLPTAIHRLGQDGFFRSHEPLVKPEDIEGGAK